jgi:transcriptional regulator with XRE-family HTH domain
MGSRKTAPTLLSGRVGRNIRLLRKMRGWTAQDLSDQLDLVGCTLSREGIAKRETSQPPVVISVDELFALADVFDRPVTDLVAEQVACGSCSGSPPAGFSCNACGAGVEVKA